MADPKDRSATGKVAVGVGWIVAWRMATRNLGLISTLLLVRLLRPEDFGLVALASSLIATIDMLSSVGAGDALIRATDPDRGMYDTAFTIGLLRGGVTATAIVAAAWPMGTWFGDERVTTVMLALAFGTVLTSLENIGIIDFRRDIAFDKEFVLNVWPRVISVAVTIVAALWLRSYWALVIGTLSNRLVRLPLTYRMSPYRPRLALRSWRHLVGFSFWSWAQSMQFLVRDRVDAFVIGRLMGTKAYGLFSVGMEIGRLPSSELVEPLSRALFSGFAAQQHDTEATQDMYLGSLGVSFLLICPAGIGISALADPVVRLMLGEQWLAAVPVMQILAIGGVSTVFVYPSGALLTALGRIDLAFYLYAITTVLKVVLLLVLVNYAGLVGGAIALNVVDWIDAVTISAAALHCMRASAGALLKRLVRPVLASLAMVAVLGWLGMAWTPTTATGFGPLCLDAATRVAVGAVGYAVALVVLWLAAGRPAGAERAVLGMLGKVWRRVGLGWS